MTSDDGVTHADRIRLPAPRWALLIIIVVECGAVALVVLGLTRAAVVQFDRAAIAAISIAAVGVLHVASAVPAERARLRIAPAGRTDPVWVWAFAGALALPPLHATGVVLVLAGWSWLLVLRPAGAPLAPHAFTTAVVVLAVHAAGAVHAVAPFSPAAVAGAALAWGAVRIPVQAGADVLARRVPVRRAVTGEALVLEGATLSLGALTAALVAGPGPLHVVLAGAPVLLLHRALLADRLEAAAEFDAKTGLLALPVWWERAAERLRRTGRRGGIAALLVLDVDHFKRLNDEHGHLVGDQALREVARTVRAQVRHDDLVGRFGGEEFVVLLPARRGRPLTRTSILEAAERIRGAVADLRLPIGGGAGTARVSISIGVAVFPDDGADAEHLLAAADVALYIAKHTGRDTVRISEAAAVPRPREPPG